MSTTETTTDPDLPAAWYRDPSGRHERRWWDGREWSDRVVDGDHESSDPPIRSRPATAEPEAEADSRDDGAAAEDDDGPPKDPMAGFVGTTSPRVPIEERPTTAPAVGGRGASRRGLVLTLAGGAIVIASLLWGMANHRTADEWRDRGEALQEELVTQASNSDALEDALGRAASRGAQAVDGQESFAEVEEAAVATVDQLRRCAIDLNDLLNVLATAGDPTAGIDAANASCNAAAVNGETLIAVLGQITGP